jgi:hypothetical protein
LKKGKPFQVVEAELALNMARSLCPSAYALLESNFRKLTLRTHGLNCLMPPPSETTRRICLGF